MAQPSRPNRVLDTLRGFCCTRTTICESLRTLELSARAGERLTPSPQPRLPAAAPPQLFVPAVPFHHVGYPDLEPTPHAFRPVLRSRTAASARRPVRNAPGREHLEQGPRSWPPRLRRKGNISLRSGPVSIPSTIPSADTSDPLTETSASNLSTAWSTSSSWPSRHAWCSADSSNALTDEAGESSSSSALSANKVVTGTARLKPRLVQLRAPKYPSSTSTAPPASTSASYPIILDFDDRRSRPLCPPYSVRRLGLAQRTSTHTPPRRQYRSTATDQSPAHTTRPNTPNPHIRERQPVVPSPPVRSHPASSCPAIPPRSVSATPADGDDDIWLQLAKTELELGSHPTPPRRRPRRSPPAPPSPPSPSYVGSFPRGVCTAAETFPPGALREAVGRLGRGKSVVLGLDVEEGGEGGGSGEREGEEGEADEGDDGGATWRGWIFRIPVAANDVVVTLHLADW